MRSKLGTREFQIILRRYPLRISIHFSSFFNLCLSYLYQSTIFIFFLYKSFSRCYINFNPRIIRERRHRRMKIFLSLFFSFSLFFYFMKSFIKNDRMLPTRCRDIIKICLLGFDLIRPTIPLVPFPTAVLSRHLGRRFFTNPTFVTNPSRLSSLPSFQLPTRTLEKIEETYQGKSKSLN